MEKRKNMILLAVTGMTPQVITETLYSLLVQRNETVEEIDILTTSDGKAKLVELKLDEQIKKMCTLYKKKCPNFDIGENVYVAQEEAVELQDIRTDRDNLLFPDLIVKMIREKTEDKKRRLHCSIAGGRKTMSVAMAFALSLFGRSNDQLSHVLVSKEFENSKKFFPENKREGKQIILADVPFIRLGDKLPLLKEYPDASFTQLVELTQRGIEELISIPPIIVYKSKRSVKVDGIDINFSPFQFAVYLFFLKSKAFIPGGKLFRVKDSKLILQQYKRYASADQYSRRIRSNEIRGGLLEFNPVQKAIAEIKMKFRKALRNEILINNYIIGVRGGYAMKEYGILLDKSKIKWN